jgi:hypothetical protein
MLWIGIAIGVVVVIVIVAVALMFIVATSPKIDVTAVNYEFTGDSCSGWTTGTMSGTNVSAGSQITLTLGLTNTALLGYCNATSVTTTTSGFSVVSSNAPLNVSATQTESLSIVVGTPSSSYTGVLTIVISVTTGL